MAGETIQGLTLRVGHPNLLYPAVLPVAREGLLSNLAAQCAEQGLQMLSAPTIVREIPVKYVPVVTPDGETLHEEEQCRPEDAECLLIIAEVTCAAR